MTLLNALLLGLIQGLTEFLPISSTAHLTIAGKIMGLIDPAKPEEWTAFIAVIQLGTVAAVIVYFFHDLWEMARAVTADLRKNDSADRWSDDSRMAGRIIVGTLPVVILGLALKKIIEGNFTKSLSVIGTSLIALALILLWAEKAGKRSRTETGATWRDALLVGIAQAFALIPGSSRSGTTITAGLFLGFTRETAARFSFLLSIPAVLASGLFEAYRARHELGGTGILPLVLSTITAGITGYSAIAFLLKYLRTHSTFVFIWYRIGLGAVLLWAVGMNLL
jgi:undecaprenyl-diphosphatase